MQEVPLPFAEDAAVSGRSDPIRIGRRFHTESTRPTPIPRRGLSRDAPPTPTPPFTSLQFCCCCTIALLILPCRLPSVPPPPRKTYARARPTALRRDDTLRGRPREGTRLLSLFSGVKGNKPSSVPHQVSCETIWHATLFIASLNQHLMVTLTGII